MGALPAKGPPEMSTDLIFGGVAIAFDLRAGIARLRELSTEPAIQSLSSWDKDAFMVLLEVGNNRTFDDQGRVARDTYLEALGTHADCIGRACRAAGDFEGGGIRFATTRHTKIEAYVSWVRSLMSHSVPLRALRTRVELHVATLTDGGQPLDMAALPGGAALLAAGLVAPLHGTPSPMDVTPRYIVKCPADGDAEAMLTWLALFPRIVAGGRAATTIERTSRLYEIARQDRALASLP